MIYAFGKNKRLLTKKEYGHVFEQAKKVGMPTFFALTRANDKETARLGFAFSKKQLSKASSRNRIRRIMRESFRLQSLVPVDIVILAKFGLDKQTNQEINQDMTLLWKKINNIYG